ncbi:IS66 family transposase [bacterium AH-315-N03]|nr:IS66 family transposase [bacterium AH-315-N03]
MLLGVNLKRETDIEQLRRIALMQQVQIENLLKVLASQSQRIEQLVGSPGELQQALALLETQSKKAAEASGDGRPEDAPKKERKKRTKFGSTPQPLLPLVEQVFELDEPDKMCPACGGELRPMAGQFDASEMVDVVEVEYRLVTVKQQKYSCGCGGCVETAPGPERAVRGGRYSLAFAVKVAIDKYLDHLPLNRQARIMKRHGLVVTSQGLWDQLHALAKRLRVVWEELFAHVMREPVIGLDQTGWKRLENKKAKPWQIWCLTAPGVVYHRIYGDKSAETFRALVGDFEGAIVCDALSTHHAGARASPGIVLAGCWAHVFRRFEEAAPDHPEALLAMKWIGELYDIDERADGDLDVLAELRRTESVLVLDKMKTWLWSQAPLKTLSIGKAAAYAIGDWKRLVRFVENPRIPLDNNATERGVRGPVVGRRNHFGSKSRRGTEVASIIYSIVETAKLHDIDPAAYMAEAARLAPLGEVLMPWQFVQA